MGGVTKPSVKWLDTHAFVTRKGVAGSRSLCGISREELDDIKRKEQCKACKKVLKRGDFVSFIP